MKYFRSQNLNPAQVRDHSVWRKPNGDIELNPTNNVIINGGLLVDGNVPGPEVTNILYVTLDGNDENSGRGEGPDQAKRTLKSALAVAQQGTTIIVRSGEYFEDNPLKVPPHVTILGDSLRNTILRPLNGPSIYSIASISRSNNVTTVTTAEPHERVIRDRVRIRCSNTAIDETDVNILEIIDDYTFTYRQQGDNISSTSASGRVLFGRDMFHVNSKDYIAQLVIKSLRAPAYCVSIDSDAIVDTSPYVQNCSNITGPFMNNGEEWLPFVTEQPDINGVMVTGPRPLLDSEIDPTQLDVYGIDTEGAGGGMIIDGDKYSTESPIKSMVGDAFTQVTQGGIGFHITNFGYMQLVSCFAVFCSKAFYTTRGGYLSISNSVVDFGNAGFTADGYYLDPYAEGDIEQDYYSTVGSITVTVEGEGYVSTPIAIIDPPTTLGGVQATATVNLDPITRRVNAISVDNPGSGYDFVPNVTITGGSPSVNAEATVNLSKNQTITVSGLPSKPQIGSIMFLGDDPTSYYISDTVGNVAPFSYDEAKCARDTGIIIDGIYYDVALGTNYNSIINGLSYRRAMASEVIDNQLVQTVGALRYTQDQAATFLSDSTAVARNTAAFNELIDIIENGAASADALTFPIPTGVDPNVENAFNQLRNNREFIRNEIIAWIADQVAVPNAPFTSGFTYDEATCSRDIGYIVDALSYDMLYGGNSASKVAAEAYFNGAVSVLPTAQRLPTIATMNRLSVIVQEIIQESVVSTSSGTTLSQNFTADPGTATEASTADTLLQIIEDVITAGDILSIPSTVYPAITWTDSSLQTAVGTLALNKSTIVDNTIDFINSEYARVFSYDQQKCRRDVRIITNAVITDMIYGSNYQSTAAGLSYLRSYASKVTSTQKSQTLGALETAKTAVLALTSNPTAQTRITDNFDIVIGIIRDSLGAVPTIVMPTPSGGRSGFSEAAAILNANKDFLISELNAWIALNYPTLTYDEAKCSRDIGYIIDAMRYDMIYGGNSQTINAALAYVEGSVIEGEVEETLETYRYWQTIVGSILTNNPITRTIGNTLTQDITIPVGTPVPSPNSPSDIAEALLGIIVNELDHGPGYIPDPIELPDYSIGDVTLAAERTAIYSQIMSVQDQVIDYLQNAYGGSIQVYVFPAITSVLTGTQVRFHNVSTISTGGTALEYVGAGVTYNALPFFGGEPDPTTERVEINNGKCFTVSNDQVGNYRIGQFFTVNALTGAVTIDAENLNLSGLAAIGPFKRNGIPVGVQLREVSDNANLIASTGTQDANTVPTQTAVSTYVENRYLNKVGTTAQTVASDISFEGQVSLEQDLEIKGGDLTTDQTTFNLLDTVAETINFGGNATDIQVGAATGATTVNNDLAVVGDATIGTDDTNQHTVNGSVDINNGPLTINNDDGVSITTGTVGNGVTIDTFATAGGQSNLHINTKVFDLNTGSTTPVQRLVVNESGIFTILTGAESTDYTNGTVVITGGVGISGNLNVQGTQFIGGNLDISGTVVSSTQTSFSILPANVATLSIAPAATTIDIAASTGTTTVNNSLVVSGDVTLGTDSTNLITLNGRLDISLPDNVPSAFELSEGLNSYFKLATTDGSELVTFGEVPKVTVLNTEDATNTATASVVLAGGLGVAKKVFIGSDLTVEGNTTLGNEVSTDTMSVTGTVDVLVPDDGASVFNIRENASNYFTVVTTNTDESITIGTTPKLKVTNVTDSSSKTTGALLVSGGAGIEKNLTVGIDLQVDRDAVVTGDLAVNGGDLTTTSATFNLINTNAATVNFAGAGTAIAVGAATGTTNFKHNVDIDLDLNVDGGDITTNQTAFNLINANAVDINFAGAATTLVIAATTGDTDIRNNLNVGIDLNVTGENLTTSSTTFNLVNDTATTVNFAGAGTLIEIGAATGTTNINNNLVVDLDLEVKGGDLTTNQLTFNLLDTTATTINFGGDATTVSIGSATGTTTVNHNLSITGDVNIDGGDLTATTTSFNLLNTTVTSLNLAGSATSIIIGDTTGTTNIRHDVDIDGNLNIDLDLNVNGGDITTNATTFNLLNATATTINAFGAAETINIGVDAAGTASITVGPQQDANELHLNSLADGSGSLTVSSDITTGTVNLFADITTGTINIANSGASTVNLGSSTSTVNIGELVLTTDLEVQYGGTGQSSFTTNGVLFGNAAGALQVTAASDPDNTNAITSYGILTTDGSNVPVWTDVIDGGSY